MENQRLVAKLTTTVLMRNKSFRSKEKTEFGSEMTNFQDYYDTHAPHSSVKTNSDAEYSDDKPKLLTASLFGESGTEDASGPGNTSKQYQSLDKTVIDIPSTLKSKDSSRSEVSFFSVEEAASLDQVSKLSQTLPINASLDSKFGKDSKKNQDLSAEEKISQLISMNDREIKELNSQSKMSRGSGSKSANDVSSNFSKKKMPPQNLSASSSELNLSITSLSGGIADTLPFKKNDKKKSGNNKKALSFQKDRHVQLPSLNRN